MLRQASTDGALGALTGFSGSERGDAAAAAGGGDPRGGYNDGRAAANVRSQCSEPTIEKTLLFEVGANAYEYLGECFFSEASVLDRGIFKIRILKMERVELRELQISRSCKSAVN